MNPDALDLSFPDPNGHDMRPSHGTLPDQPRDPRRDAGVTLPELLISIVITGTIIASIALAFSVVLSSNGPAYQRISESKDVTFVQTYLPLDMAAAIAPTEAQAAAGMKAINDDADHQPVAGLTLEGTNAVTVRRSEVTGSGSAVYIVSYRYLQQGDEWVLMRYEIHNPGTGSQTVNGRVVAYELAPPPVGWQANVDKPTHAIELNARNQVVLRPVGDDITVSFESGKDFTTGGSALSKGLSLATNNFGGFAQTTAPPTKCGGDLALVIDTSGSVPANNSGSGNGGIRTEQAAQSFIDAFRGTPTRLGIYGYDNRAYTMFPGAGALVSMLDPTNPQIDAAVNRITVLDDWGPTGNGGWPGAGGPIDPNGDGIHWDQTGSGTNWEDGIRAPFFATEDPASQYSSTPTLAVLITDGQPNRTISGGNATTEAANMAKAAKQTGARLVGVLVGQTNESNMKAVVGNTKYSASENNAASADYFAGSFDQMGDLLREIAVAECGGTITVQKRIDTGSGLVSPSSGVWNYTAESGTSTLDRSKASSVTFDYNIAGNATTTDTIYEQVGGDYVFDRYECYSQGQLLASPKVSPALDAETGDVVPGVQVTIRPDEAISCLMISVPK